MLPRPNRLRARQMRDIMRLVGEVRERGRDPVAWRRHAVVQLAELTGASTATSMHVRCGVCGPRIILMIDAHRTCDPIRPVLGLGYPSSELRIQPSTQATGSPRLSTVGFEPGSRRFTHAHHLIVSNIKLPDGTFDQLLLQRSGDANAFERHEAVLVWVFHRELRRIWFAAVQRQGPITSLPDYLRRTFDRLIDGSSEKEVANQLGLSGTTVHGYVKQIYAQLNVQSRGELLARFGSYDFVPRLGPPANETAHEPRHFAEMISVKASQKPARFRVRASRSASIFIDVNQSIWAPLAGS